MSYIEFDKLKIGDKITIDFPEKGKIEATIVNVLECSKEIILKTEEGEIFSYRDRTIKHD